MKIALRRNRAAQLLALLLGMIFFPPVIPSATAVEPVQIKFAISPLSKACAKIR